MKEANKMTAVVRVLMGIQRAAYRLERDQPDQWKAVLEMHRIIGRLMSMNGISVCGELL